MTEMEPEATPEPTASAPQQPARPGRSRESRAALAFYALGIFAGVIWLIVVVAGFYNQIVPAWTFVLGLSVPVLAFIAGYGIDRRTSWGLGAMVPLLVLQIVSGAVDTLIAVTESRISIPIGLIVAVWALRGTPERPEGHPIDGAAAVLIGAFVIATVAPYLIR